MVQLHVGVNFIVDVLVIVRVDGHQVHFFQSVHFAVFLVANLDDFAERPVSELVLPLLEFL